VSRAAGLFDKYVVDGVVNFLGMLGKNLGFAVGQFDYHIVDGTVRGLGETAKGAGGVLSMAQGGNLRRYVMMMVILALVALALVVLTAGVVFAANASGVG
jgi:hypothetical protein